VYSDLKMDGYYLGDNPYLTDDAIRIIRAAYYGMVSMIDDGMTRILGALQSRGLDERTLVFFLTDHGELLGDHGLILKGPFHYQSSLRVPLLARGPGLPSGHVVNGPVGLIDLFPTLLELAGASAPDGIQSESLVPQLTGTSSAGRDGVLIEQDVDVMDIRLRSMISDRWRITHYASQPYGELYDLESDPNEFENLWDRGDPKVKNELLAQLLDLMATNDDWLPPKVCHA
jgi:arylsulfatase A-like enzyme